MKAKSLAALLYIPLFCLSSLAAQDADDWSTTISLGFSLPFFTSELDESGTIRFDRVGGSLALGAFLVYEPNGLTFMARAGLGYVQCDIEDYNDTFHGGQLYLMVGVGKRLALGRFVFIPSVGVGLAGELLFADYNWSDHQYDDAALSIDFLLCSDLTAQFMFTKRLGLELSCMVSTNVTGGCRIAADRAGDWDETACRMKFGMCNVVPAVLLCAKF